MELGDGGLLDQITFQYLFALLRPFSLLRLTAEAMLVTFAILQIMIASFHVMVLRTRIDTVVWDTFICSVFLTIILLASTILPGIINSFTAAGKVVSGLPSLTPSTVLDQGLSLAAAIFKNMSFWGLVKSLGLTGAVGIVCAFLTYLSFILIAVSVMYTQVRAFYMIGVGVLMLGFAGWRFTRPIAEHFLAKTIGIGVNLLTLYVIVGVAITVSQTWGPLLEGAGFAALNLYLVTLGAALFLVFLAWLMPTWADAMTVSGINFSIAQLSSPLHFSTASTARTFQAASTGVHAGAQGIRAVRQGFRAGAAASAAAGGGWGGTVAGVAAGAHAAYQTLRNSAATNGASQNTPSGEQNGTPGNGSSPGTSSSQSQRPGWK
jgi:P-type conjugative transfer protein TrbL